MITHEYFASKKTEEIGAEITSKVDDYQNYLMASGQVDLWNRAYNNYYRGGLVGGKLRRGGEQSEFLLLDVNHYKSLINSILAMTTNQKLALDPVATNSDSKSLAQTKLSKGLLDYYMRSKRVSRYIKNQVKHGLLYGEGWILQEWDTTLGADYTQEEGQIVKEGDLSYRTILPHFVCRDVTKYDFETNEWFIYTTFENKYDLAARYPGQAEAILGQSMDFTRFYSKLSIAEKEAWNNSDDIEVHTLIHKKNAILPQGRQVKTIGSGLVLFDGPIPYRNLTLNRLAPETQEFSPFGYSVGFDLLAIQEAIISLYSTACTNNSTFGVQNILIPRGFSISINTLSEGLNVIEYDPKAGKPEPLNLTLTAPELYNLIERLERLMETISGVNSVTRGNPEASLKSGNALALVQSMSIMAQTSLQQSYVESLEDISTSAINILQDYASVPRVALIAGKFSRSYMKEFKGSDLDKIQRVVVDMGNPLARTLAGRTQIAENLLEAGFIKDADQYLVVLETGTLDPVLEGPMRDQYQIRQENENLADGLEAVAIITDKHAEHIMEHRSVLSSPESRQDPKIVQTTLAHIMKHIALLKSADPALLQILGQQSLAPQTAPNPSNALPPGADAGGEVPQVEPVNDITAEAASTQLPNMPKNALTGQEFNNVDGGLPQ